MHQRGTMSSGVSFRCWRSVCALFVALFLNRIVAGMGFRISVFCIPFVIFQGVVGLVIRMYAPSFSGRVFGMRCGAAFAVVLFLIMMVYPFGFIPKICRDEKGR